MLSCADVVKAGDVVFVCRRCDERGCDGLLRPDVIWFGETLDSHVLTKVEKELDACDLCLLVRSRVRALINNSETSQWNVAAARIMFQQRNRELIQISSDDQ